MSMGSRKVNTEGIDEELLLASIGRRTQDGTLRPAQEVPAAAPTEEDTAAPEPPPVWKSHSTLPLLATQNYPFWLKYD
ncbi:hypothetical protein DXA23_20295 [Phocaeicola vulgatus]|nr:hypothetical protein DXA23_20295 [Phocaeicola vulgatus]